jgi:hypothetical protein
MKTKNQLYGIEKVLRENSDISVEGTAIRFKMIDERYVYYGPDSMLDLNSESEYGNKIIGSKSLEEINSQKGLCRKYLKTSPFRVSDLKSFERKSFLIFNCAITPKVPIFDPRKLQKFFQDILPANPDILEQYALYIDRAMLMGNMVPDFIKGEKEKELLEKILNLKTNPNYYDSNDEACHLDEFCALMDYAGFKSLGYCANYRLKLPFAAYIQKRQKVSLGITIFPSMDFANSGFIPRIERDMSISSLIEAIAKQQKVTSPKKP